MSPESVWAWHSSRVYIKTSALTSSIDGRLVKRHLSSCVIRLGMTLLTKKVGRRTNETGYFHDSYLSLPRSLERSSRHSRRFQSKPVVQRYIESNFPNMKIEEFFALFSWKVPTTKRTRTKEDTNPIQNFDKYLDTLDDLLGMPHTGITPCDDVTRGTSMDNKIEWCKKKLSSFLVVDFRSLVSYINLSVDELAKLKLVEQILLLSDAFMEAKGKFKEAHKLLADLKEKLKVCRLKNDYVQLKEKVTQTEAIIEGLVLNIQEINDKILSLQEKLMVKSNTLENMQKSKAELTSRLVYTANSIPTLSEKIQVELSERSKWEMEKANNAKHVAEIEEKLMCLRGLTSS
ncbi:hypothetical protein GYH30_006481 [Glycine max]|uniref:DUF7081 domain-containing protein n=1 Tax=Glycine max TaxID=3847 RepID=A0A0R0KRW7_SOYBN|nr:hypothetical protein GYH30_006481 [Glycine max]